MRAASTVPIVLALCFTCITYGQTQASSEQVLLAGRSAIQHRQYADAIHLLEDGLKNSPSDRTLKVELGRAYLYDHQDDRAIQLFKEVLREEPSNRVAELELARALGYRRDYEGSNVLYRSLLKAGPDEAAEIGLIRNLMHQGKTPEARRELAQAMARFPENKQLQEYKVKLETQHPRAIAAKRSGRDRGAEPAAREPRTSLMGTVTYLTDSAGNRCWRSTESFDFELAESMTNRVQVEERTLWKASGPKANILSATDDLKLRLTPALLVTAGGGAVRFANGSSHLLYRGDLGLHPGKSLWLSGGYSRIPIAPTFRATQFNLLAQGWHARVDWNPRQWRTNTTWSEQHYSDGNHAQRFDAGLMRWFGTPHFAVAAGYQFGYIGFNQSLRHGYFNPRRYQNHVAVTGVNLGVGRHFRGEYLVHAGGESISSTPYQIAWDVTLRNRVHLRHWELGGDYSYFHLAQDSGPFRAQSARFVVAYRF